MNLNCLLAGDLRFLLLARCCCTELPRASPPAVPAAAVAARAAAAAAGLRPVKPCTAAPGLPAPGTTRCVLAIRRSRRSCSTRSAAAAFESFLLLCILRAALGWYATPHRSLPLAPTGAPGSSLHATAEHSRCNKICQVKGVPYTALNTVQLESECLARQCAGWSRRCELFAVFGQKGAHRLPAIMATKKAGKQAS